MRIYGAVRIAETDEVVYFCEYNENDFEWADICCLLEHCTLTQNVREENIRCVAVEAIDTSPNSTAPMGLACVADGTISVHVPTMYSYIENHLKFFVEGE